MSIWSFTNHNEIWILDIRVERQKKNMMVHGKVIHDAAVLHHLESKD